jgi:hypothetical protein
MKKVICSFFAVSVMLACSSGLQTVQYTIASQTVQYTIASQTANCMGAAPQKCLLVKKADAAQWQYFYSPIEGFTHQDGYEYVLEIREEKQENPPADASSIKYILVKVVSKTKKASENLPAKQNHF